MDVLNRHFFKETHMTVACVIDQNVDPAKSRYCCIDRFPRLCGVGNVQFNGHQLTAVRPKTVNESGPLASCGDNPVSRPHGGFDDFKAKPAAGACDKPCLLHCRSPIS